MTVTERLRTSSLRVQNVIALSLLFALPWFGYALLFKPLQWLFPSAEYYDELREDLSKDRAWAQSAGSIAEHSQTLSSSDLWQQLYVAKSKEEGAAKLLMDLRSVLGHSGVDATSEIEMRSGEPGGPPEVGARLVAIMVVSQLQQVLQQISTHTRLLEVRRLSVTAPPSQSPNENPSLTVTLEVVGYLDPRALGARS